MTIATAPVTTGWFPAAGVTERGHVVLYVGRGEHPDVYERFGRRLAFDGYRVSAVGGEEVPEVPDTAGPTPLVLAGSDIGALRALAAIGPHVAGLLLVGVPTQVSAPITVGWDEELDARTACPVHRGRLDGDDTFGRGALGSPVPAELVDAAASAQVDVPTLLVHGGADRVAPLAGARALAARLPRAELVVVRDGRHDVVNDVHHRSVAAHVVAWLERLRADPSAAPIVDYEEG